jgi:hypothetical protein
MILSNQRRIIMAAKSPKQGGARSAKGARDYFEFEVSLLDIRPRIWRRFQIAASASFADLHLAIQKGFGWENCHLWEFYGTGRERQAIAGVPDDEGPLFGEPTPDAAKVKLSTYFGGPEPVARCRYIYDMGDGWVHEVKLRKQLADPKRFRRRLIAGARACPLEDCGGVPGYEHLAEFLRTGKSAWGDDPEELREWVGDWDPERFDVEEVKARFDR